MLDAITKSNLKPSFEMVCKWLRCVMEAVTILRQNKLIHQDLRMLNIMINGDVAKIIDFNIMVPLEPSEHEKQVYTISKDSMRDITISPYYPPCYYTNADEFINKLIFFSVYDKKEPGDLYNLYCQIHGINSEEALKQYIAKSTLTKADVDSYSLGIIMMQVALLLGYNYTNTDAAMKAYFDTARQLTNLNPQRTQEGGKQNVKVKVTYNKRQYTVYIDKVTSDAYIRVKNEKTPLSTIRRKYRYVR